MTKRELILFIVFSTSALTILNAQDAETPKTYHFNGDWSVTNNGFSFIPSFSLGKPATIVNLNAGGHRFSFDTQFRFEVEGLKPWSFIFIWRYEIIKQEKLSVKLGTHMPALSFRKQNVIINGIDREQVFIQRWITPELTVNYKLTDHINIGSYCISGFGMESIDQSKNTTFLSLKAGFSRIPLGEQLTFKWFPQVYYLNSDGTDGYYTAHSFFLTHQKSPISIGSTINKAIQTDIASKDFDWNVSLIYTFKNTLVKQ